MIKINYLHLFKAALAICLTLLAGNALAAGTSSGTSISNIATVSYDVETVPQTPISSTVASFVVDNKINLAVTTQDTTEVGTGAGQLASVTRFLVTNLSNSAQDYALSSVTTGAGIANPFGGAADAFDPTACSIHVENGATVGYQAAQDTATFVDELAADASQVVYLVCDIPVTALSNQVATVALSASTRAAGSAGLGAPLVQSGPATSGVDIVFADTQPPLAGVVGDALRDAAASAASAYKIGLAVILTKSVVCSPSPACTNQFKPGDTVTYQILVNVTGVGVASNLVISDPIPANLSYTANSISLNAAARTDAADADNSAFAANTVSVNLGNIAAPQSFTIRFRAVVN